MNIDVCLTNPGSLASGSTMLTVPVQGLKDTPKYSGYGFRVDGLILIRGMDDCLWRACREMRCGRLTAAPFGPSAKECMQHLEHLVVI